MVFPLPATVAGPVTPATLDDSWLTWTASADDADELELASALHAALPPEQDSPDVAVWRARLFLLQGRPEEALAELVRHGLTEAPVQGSLTWAELVLVAVRAALGDPASFHRLLEAASLTAGELQSWRAAYLVAAAAEQLGHQAIADQAWRTLALEHSIVTPLTVSRLAAGEVARRDPLDHDAVTAVVMTQARNLSRLVPPPAEDPGPVLAAAAGLRARGDDAGARLLLRAVVRLNPANPELSAALLEVTPTRAEHRHVAVVVAVTVLCTPLALLGLLGAGIAFGARKLWTLRVRIPGLSRADSVAWRAVGALSFDESSGTVRTETDNASGWYGLAGILGFGVGVFVGYLASESATALLGAPNDAVSIGMWLLGIVGVPVLFVLGARAAHRRFLTSRRRRHEAKEVRRRLAEAAQCHCWQTRGLTGQLAEAYLTAHLEPVRDAPTLAELSRRLGPRAVVGQCPVTGGIWLGGSLGRGGTTVLLRGTVPALPDPAVAPLPGFYL
jgi:hypothetical protein